MKQDIALPLPVNHPSAFLYIGQNTEGREQVYFLLNWEEYFLMVHTTKPIQQISFKSTQQSKYLHKSNNSI